MKREIAIIIVLGLFAAPGQAGTAAPSQRGNGRGGGGGGGGGGGAPPPSPPASDGLPALAFVAADRQTSVLIVAEADGSNQTVILDGDRIVDGIQVGNIERASWSPDGEWLAFATVNRIGIVSNDGQDAWFVNPGGTPLEVEGLDYLEWSPDGRWLLYSIEWPDPELYAIEVQSVDGGPPFSFVPPDQLTYTPADTEERPRWSNDTDAITGFVYPDLKQWQFGAPGAGDCVAGPCLYNEQTVTIPAGIASGDYPMAAKAHDFWFVTRSFEVNFGTIWFFDSSGVCDPVQLLETAGGLWDWSGDNRDTAEDETDTWIVFQVAPGVIDAMQLQIEPDTDGNECVTGASDPVTVIQPQKRSKIGGSQRAVWRR